MQRTGCSFVGIYFLYALCRLKEINQRRASRTRCLQSRKRSVFKLYGAVSYNLSPIDNNHHKHNAVSATRG